MKTQISRDSHNPDEHYSGVYQQQGRMITDADWNELVEILKVRLDNALKDIVGSGTPNGSSLHVKKGQDTPFIIKPGTVYVNGLRGEIKGTKSFEFDKQPDFPHAPSPNVNSCIYVDLWERTVISLEDDKLRDPGLQGADTCSRTQTMVQVKHCPQAIYPTLPTIGSATVNLELWDNSAAGERNDPCLTETQEKARIGNYLFRVEVHNWQVNEDGTVELTLKWSSENGAEQESLLGHDAQGYSNLPPQFIGRNWTYEVYNDISEKHLGFHSDSAFTPARGILRQSTALTEPLKLPTGKPVKGNPIINTDPQYIRRWDGYCTVSLLKSPAPDGKWQPQNNDFSGYDKGRPLTLTSTDSQQQANVFFQNNSLKAYLDGLIFTINFDEYPLLPGDYWLAVIRENAEYLPDTIDKRVEIQNDGKPVGIRHHYLEIGFQPSNHPPEETGTEQERQLNFPPLTNLTANRVQYTPNDRTEKWNGINQPDRQPITVQQAIDDLIANVAYVILACDSPNSVRRRLPSLETLEDGAIIQITQVLNALLCELDASRIPYSVGEQTSVQELMVKKTGDSMTGSLKIATGGLHIGTDSEPGDNNLIVDGNCTIAGDLTVQGTTTTVNTEELRIKDKIITLNKYDNLNPNTNNYTNNYTNNSGIEVYRGSDPQALILWDENEDRWKIGVSGNLLPIATGVAQDVVTGVVTFNNLPLQQEMLSDDIDSGLGTGALLIQLALEERIQGTITTITGDSSSQPREVIYRAVLNQNTGKFQVYAKRLSGLKSPPVHVRWWAQKPRSGEINTNPVSISLSIKPSTANLKPGDTQPFTANVTGTTNTKLTWTATRGDIISPASTPATIIYQATEPGNFEVTVTSNADSSIVKHAQVTVSDVTVSIDSQKKVSLLLGKDTYQFSAKVSGGQAPVTWSVNDILGGNDNVGRISDTGLYISPMTMINTSQDITIKASTTGSAQSDFATVSIQKVSVSITQPRDDNTILDFEEEYVCKTDVINSLNQAVTWKINKIGFFSGWAPFDGIFTGTMMGEGDYQIFAKSQADNSKDTEVRTIRIRAVSVSIIPPTEQIRVGGNSYQFIATVAGVADATKQKVTWSRTGEGEIDQNGLYTAPLTMKTPAIVTIKATSVADTSKFTEFTFRIPEVLVSISKPFNENETISLKDGESYSCAAIVELSTNPNVKWFKKINSDPSSDWIPFNGIFHLNIFTLLIGGKKVVQGEGVFSIYAQSEADTSQKSQVRTITITLAK